MRIPILSFALALAAMTPPPADVQIEPTPRQWEQSSSSKHDRGFAGKLLMTPDADWWEKWDTPSHTTPHFSSTDRLMIGDSATLMIFFANPRRDPTGGVDVLVDIKVTRGDGSVSIDEKAIPCLQGPMEGSPTQIRLCESQIVFVAEPNDPLGVWRFEVRLHDAVRRVDLDLEVEVELVDPET
ncbi:MAG: hypothetical protein H6748_07640 [Spirochaetaceae bacterium]|nr:hypothetical protein [Spirochaetaceae bacterium]